jgi:hypothetical protein
MSSAMMEPVEDLEQILHRRGNPMSAGDFLDVLAELGGDSEPLTRGEAQFLVQHGGVPAEDLTEEARRQTRLRIAQERSRVSREVAESSLTTGQVASMRGRADAGVRRSAGTGDLYALNQGDSRGLRFPRWQFAGSQVLPGLRRIVPTFPRNTHPLTIESFMTRPSEELDGLTPVSWLAGGGSVDAVVELIDELSRV